MENYNLEKMKCPICKSIITKKFYKNHLKTLKCRSKKPMFIQQEED